MGRVESYPEIREHRQELLHYLEDSPSILARWSGVPPGSFCNRAPVGAPLQYYSATARRQKIRAGLALTISTRVPLGDMERYTVLSNLPENVLKACQRQDRGERRLPLIS